MNSDDVTGENIKKHNPNWPKIPDHPYRILIIGGLGLEKTSGLLHLIIHQPDIDKICLYAKDPREAKYQLVINKCESVGLKRCDDSNAVIGCLNDMDGIYESISEYNTNKKRKILIVFGGGTADMLSNKTLQPIVTELFIRSRKESL